MAIMTDSVSLHFGEGSVLVPCLARNGCDLLVLIVEIAVMACVFMNTCHDARRVFIWCVRPHESVFLDVE